MDLSELAAFADLIAAAGVILSIGFLIYELRQTRAQTELSNWRDLLQSIADYKGLTQDAALADLVLRGHEDYAALTPAEQLSFGLYLEQGIHLYGNFLKHNDALPRKLEGLDAAIGNSMIEMLTTPGGAAWWAANRGRSRFMPGTYRTIDRIVRNGHIATDT
jgi:hypothetical protein